MRTAIRLFSLAALGAAPAHAHGGLSSLAGLRTLLWIVTGSFALTWVAVWMVSKVVVRARRASRGEPPRPVWLRDPAIPRGVRLLALVQYLLAFFYALGGVTTLVFSWPLRPTPAYFILFSVVFAVLAIRSANAYLRGPAGQGLRSGVALGWLCLIGAGLYLVVPGPGFDFVALAFGGALLALLNWRYRPYFEPQKKSDA